MDQTRNPNEQCTNGSEFGPHNFTNFNFQSQTKTPNELISSTNGSEDGSQTKRNKYPAKRGRYNNPNELENSRSLKSTDGLKSYPQTIHNNPKQSLVNIDLIESAMCIHAGPEFRCLGGVLLSTRSCLIRNYGFVHNLIRRSMLIARNPPIASFTQPNVCKTNLSHLKTRNLIKLRAFVKRFEIRTISDLFRADDGCIRLFILLFPNKQNE